MKTLALVLSLVPFAAIAFDPDIIIDANTPMAPATVTLTGAWTSEVAPNLANAFRGDSKVVSNSSAATHAVFKTRLPKTGPYSVFVWHNGGTSYFGSNHTAQVTHADTAPSTAALNQSMYPGQWLLLGTFWFEGNDNGLNTCKEAEVKIIGSGNMKLSADAVRFMPATPDLLVDSDPGTSVVFTGTWTSTADKAGNAGNVRRASSVSSTAAAAYTFTLPVGGDYDVSVWLPGNAGSWLAGGNSAASFAVEIQHPTVANQNPPASTTVSVTLATLGTNEGQWVRLINPATISQSAPRTGTFRFKPTGTGIVNKVTIKTASATGAGSGPWQVPADAVRLSKVGTWAAFMDEDDPPAPPTPWVGGTSNWTNNTAATARIWSDWTKVKYGPAWKSFNFSSTAQGPASLSYSPIITELGLYDVYLWYPVQDSYPNNPTTKISVQSALGVVTGSVNQQNSAGMWRHAGRYILNPSNYSDPALQPKLTVSTPSNPYAPGSYYYSSWWYASQGFVNADGVMFLRDGEEADADGDGLPDWKEILLGTNSSGLDLNNDGRADGWDTDGDGMSDGDEYRLGFDPLTAAVVVTSKQLGLLRYTPLQPVSP